MGRAHEGVNAIEKAYEAIRLLRRYESRLLAQSQHYPQFERYEYPIQLNIGTIRGGVMPAMVPDAATVGGGIGFLPNKTLAGIERELHQAIQAGDDEWLKSHYELRFNRLRNDAYAIPSDHPLPQALSQCCKARGKQGEIFGWNVSCDARLYARAGKMPTVVFGPGDVVQAHASNEYVKISEVLKAAEILATFMISWCGNRTPAARFGEK
jgi:acetylornithine deacetylase